jgi:hypothetical protein
LGFSFHDFEHAFVGVIDENGRELGSSQVLAFFEGVFINSDGTRPGVLSSFELFLEARVKGFEDVSGRDAVRALDAFEVDEIFTSPEYGFLKTLGGPGAFMYAWNVFGERFSAVFAPEASFLDFEEDDLPPYWCVFDGAGASIIDRATQGGAAVTEGQFGGAPDEVMGPRAATRNDIDHFQFREQELMG